jgi:hypothetical protein
MIVEMSNTVTARQRIRSTDCFVQSVPSVHALEDSEINDASDSVLHVRLYAAFALWLDCPPLVPGCQTRPQRPTSAIGPVGAGIAYS